MTQAALRAIAFPEQLGLGGDARFFLRCYAWGFAFFLAFLS